MLRMGTRPPKNSASQKKKPVRSPSWVVYARLDPALKQPVQELIDSQEFKTDLTRVIERALKKLLEEKGLWPTKD